MCGLAGASCEFCSRFVRPRQSRGSLPVRREPPVLGRGDRPPCRMFSLPHVLHAFVLQGSVYQRLLALGGLVHGLLLVPVVERRVILMRGRFFVLDK